MNACEKYTITGNDNQYQIYQDPSIDDTAYLTVIGAINSSMLFERFQFILDYQSFNEVFE